MLREPTTAASIQRARNATIRHNNPRTPKRNVLIDISQKQAAVSTVGHTTSVFEDHLGAKVQATTHP
jgi:hypothetical protein